MSQRNGLRTATRRGNPPGASSVNGAPPEPVLAKLGPVELSEFLACQVAVNEATQVLQDAQLELQHFAMKLRQRHGWKEPNVKVNTTTGDVTPHGGPMG